MHSLSSTPDLGGPRRAEEIYTLLFVCSTLCSFSVQAVVQDLPVYRLHAFGSFKLGKSSLLCKCSIKALGDYR